MHFIKDSFLPWPTLPVRVAPTVGGGIDDETLAVHVIGLTTRSRVRHIAARSQAVDVTTAGRTMCLQREPAVTLGRHGLCGTILDHDCDPLLLRRPQPDAPTTAAEHGGSERPRL